LIQYFSSTNNPFSVFISESDKSNSIFKGITPHSVFQSFEIIESLLNGFSPSVSQNHFESLLFLSAKLFFSDLFITLKVFKESNFTIFEFNPSVSSFDDFNFNSTFTFQVSFQQFKCSTFSAFLLSRKAQRLYNFENISELILEIPSKYKISDFLKYFSEFFNVVHGQSIEITENSFEIFLYISKQLQNDQLLKICFQFVSSHKFKSISEKLDFLSKFEFENENDNETLSFENLFDEIAENFNSLNIESLSDILPKSLFQLLKSKKLNIHSEDEKFAFAFHSFQINKLQSMFLFETIDFSKLSKSKIEQFFNSFNFSNLNLSIFNSIKQIILNPQNLPSEKEVFNQLLESDHINFLFSKGFEYFEGKTVPCDYQKSLKFFQKCTIKGHQEAHYYLKALYRKGIDVLTNYPSAVNYFENDSSNCDGDSLTYIGALYYWGISLPEDCSKALKFLVEGDSKGNSESTRMVGCCYRHGVGVGKDYSTAFEYFQKSISKGNLAAIVDLAWMYYYGNFVKQDSNKWFSLIQESALKGYVNGLNLIGWSYEKGWGVKQNYSEALRYYTEASEKGSGVSLWAISCLYKYGKGVAKDEAKVQIYQQLAEERGYM
jgi:TPR repeat protein